MAGTNPQISTVGSKPESSSHNNHNYYMPSEEDSSPFFSKVQDKANMVAAAILPRIPGLGVLLKSFLGVTVGLYVLNQKHALPRPIGAIVSKALFWPTMPITVSRRIGKWVTRIDDTVVMGGAPFGFWGYPEKLYDEYGVRGVINMCEEYRGPKKKYAELGMEQLYLPTTDHFEPALEDLISAIAFIRRHEAQGKRVYIHCRAGHGRSGAAVFAWLLYKDPIVDLETLNKEFCQMRNVRRSLWKQPNIRQLHSRLIKKGTILVDIDPTSSDEKTVEMDKETVSAGSKDEL